MRIGKKVGKRKKADKGFSLIEVLCAVVLLALIAAPVLQMFYSSYAINLRSKKYLAASDLAQTILEALSEQTWDESKSVTGTTVYPGLKDYYENNLAGYIYKKPVSGTEGPTYASVVSRWEAENGAVLPNMTQNTCEAFYFSKVKAESLDKNGNSVLLYDKPFYVKISFNTSRTVASGYYPVEVSVKVYCFDNGKDKKDSFVTGESNAPAFTPDNLSSFTLIQSASTKVPNKR